MKSHFLPRTAAAVALLAFASGDPMAAGNDYPVQPVPFTDVHFADAFWAPRLETNRAVTIPYAFAQCEENGRMANFALAGGLVEGEHRGEYPFDDTDPYKILEGASYSLAVHPDPALDAFLDDLIAKIAAAQEEDGYLYTARTNGAERLRRWMGPERWSNLARSHELYDAGHLYEAAVAHHLATGKRSLLDVAIKNADLVDATFGPGKREEPPGHQVIEIGLAKLYRVTGEEKYLRLAKFFLAVRGRHGDRPQWGTYTQDHLPVLEQTEAVGHAVRASYMYAEMADVAALTGDESYVRAIDRLWEDVVGRKMHLTGGIGSRGDGEAFGDSYELPNLTAYDETCAAIGNALWNHRLFLLHGEAKYIDVLERILYNGALAGVSLAGDRFFYDNPLESRGDHERSPWFGCACCPGNVARFIPSIPGYAYAHAGDVLYVNLFVAGEATVRMAGGDVRVVQATDYPGDGKVELTIEPAAERELEIRVRIPSWALNDPVPSDLYRFLLPAGEMPRIGVRGEPLQAVGKAGYSSFRRTWRKGDGIDLELPMPVRRVVCHAAVAENRGRVALQRGPLVYCVEWPDVPGGHVLDLQVADHVAIAAERRPEVLGGVTVLTGEGTAWQAVAGKAAGGSSGAAGTLTPFAAIPYYAWAHRGKGEMAVWLARERAAVRPRPAPTIASSARVTVSGGANPAALHDQLEAKSSIDHSNPFFHWWPRKGTLEWVQYDLARRETVSRVEIYWFDDTGRGECRLPASWRLLWRDGSEWKPVAGASEYGTAPDRCNVTTFDPVATDGLRIEVQLPAGWSAGIHEWKVE
ncbi:MAG: beta-L-arabinofuranosidase domain-containing protein [Planctomycetota bacterium]